MLWTILAAAGLLSRASLDHRASSLLIYFCWILPKDNEGGSIFQTRASRVSPRLEASRLTNLSYQPTRSLMFDVHSLW